MVVNIAIINLFAPKSFLTVRFIIIPNINIDGKMNSGLAKVMNNEMMKAANNLAFFPLVL